MLLLIFWMTIFNSETYRRTDQPFGGRDPRLIKEIYPTIIAGGRGKKTFVPWSEANFLMAVDDDVEAHDQG
jgi:hypothetical protein